MEIKIDLHNHLSSLEYIGEDFNSIIDTARMNLGPGGVFALLNTLRSFRGGFLGRRRIVQDRFQTFYGLPGYEREASENFIYVPSQDIYVVYGQEVLTKQGHILVLGHDQRRQIPDKKDLKDTLKEARDLNAVVIADHPFFLDGVVINSEKQFLENIDHFDGIEVHNGEAWLPVPGYLFSNKRSASYFDFLKREGFDIGAVCSSDGHSISEIGSSYSTVKKPDFSTPEDLRNTLRRAIRDHKDYSRDRRKNSYHGSINHGTKGFLCRASFWAGIFPQTT